MWARCECDIAICVYLVYALRVLFGDVFTQLLLVSTSSFRWLMYLFIDILALRLCSYWFYVPG